MARVAGNEGRRLDFNYYTSGRIGTVVDHTGRTWSFEYDDLGHLLHVGYPNGGTYTYAYDTAPAKELRNNIVSFTDPEGRVRVNTVYETDDRVSSQTVGSHGAAIVYGLSPAGLAERTVTDFDGTVTRYRFNGDSSIAERTVFTKGLRPGGVHDVVYLLPEHASRTRDVSVGGGRRIRV